MSLLRTFPLFAVLALIAAPVAAQVNPAVADYAAEIEATRSLLQTERKLLVMEQMVLTPEQAEKFWPLYDKYMAERKRVNDLSVKVITDYAANYQSMTDEVARQLVKDSLKFDSQMLSLRKKYVSRFGKIVSDIQVMRLFQLENKLDAIVDFDLAQQIPLVE